MFKKGSESDTSEGNRDAKDSKEYVRAPYDGLGLWFHNSHFRCSQGGVNGGLTTMGAWLHGGKETRAKLFNSTE